MPEFLKDIPKIYLEFSDKPKFPAQTRNTIQSYEVEMPDEQSAIAAAKGLKGAGYADTRVFKVGKIDIMV